MVYDYYLAIKEEGVGAISSLPYSFRTKLPLFFLAGHICAGLRRILRRSCFLSLHITI